jgi:ParB family chromosome partitioning protein
MRPIEMVPVAQVHVLNPRVRNRRQHHEMIDNIAAIGLKRPITVTRRSNGNAEPRYDLVCGQGRLEAFQTLGRDTIPAFVIDAVEEDCLLMSLVENVARRQHAPIELMKQIGVLHQRGYKDNTIAEKIGISVRWVAAVVGLLERGEERLVAAVETGLIPVSLATTIARSDDAGIQQALADAYTEGKLKGRKLEIVRRLLARRAQRGKHGSTVSMTPFGRRGGSRKLTAAHLMRVYQRQVEKQQLLIKKADFTQSRLLFVVEALRVLKSDRDFVNLLHAEGLHTMPRALEERMAGGLES